MQGLKITRHEKVKTDMGRMKYANGSKTIKKEKVKVFGSRAVCMQFRYTYDVFTVGFPSTCSGQNFCLESIEIGRPFLIFAEYTVSKRPHRSDGNTGR
jgi:hypothetical protein